MRISFLVAAADNGVIGRDNRLPWHLPADMRHFARTTRGGTLLMGRKTYESLSPSAERPNPLAGRRLIVVTRTPERLPESDELAPAPSVTAGLAAAADKDCGELFVVGGERIFTEALPYADRLYLTRVHTEPEGDTFFPRPAPAQWRVVSAEYQPADGDNLYACTFHLLERQQA